MSAVPQEGERMNRSQDVCALFQKVRQQKDRFSEQMLALLKRVNDEHDKEDTSMFVLGGPIEFPQRRARW